MVQVDAHGSSVCMPPLSWGLGATDTTRDDEYAIKNFMGSLSCQRHPSQQHAFVEPSQTIKPSVLISRTGRVAGAPRRLDSHPDHNEPSARSQNISQNITDIRDADKNSRIERPSCHHFVCKQSLFRKKTGFPYSCPHGIARISFTVPSAGVYKGCNGLKTHSGER